MDKQRHLIRKAAELVREAADLLARASGETDFCPHEKPVDMTTMGAKVRTFRCGACGAVWTEAFPLVGGTIPSETWDAAEGPGR